MKQTIITSLLLLLSCVMPSMIWADDYVLEITKIVLQRSPQTGELWAGCTAYQLAEKENWDASVGEAISQGDSLVFPVNLEIGGIRAGEMIAMSIGMDESRAKAGKDNAEYRIELKFKVFPTRNKEKVYCCTHEGWSLKIHYRMTK